MLKTQMQVRDWHRRLDCSDWAQAVTALYNLLVGENDKMICSVLDEPTPALADCLRNIYIIS